MAAGGRNPQKSAVARARAQARQAADGSGGGGSEGQASRMFSQDAANEAQKKREKTKADRLIREKKAQEDAEKEERRKAKQLKQDAADEAAAKEAAKSAKANNTSEAAPAPAEEDAVADDLANLELSVEGFKWSVAEARDDKITKKQLGEYMLEVASDEMKATLAISKGAIKKNPKDWWFAKYVELLQAQ
eukprot:TRINITY_DN7774_c0_g1_i4.p2 TRINITY_DN7774_c0_g1~~TRINITY_DN7774_c0_g1_i4.p2  ORF type:complete len:190 (+),score=87.72 TRINITY_DN7774_c0_g1_i4:167-736(+)